MIGAISGNIFRKRHDSLLVMTTGGVAYTIFVPPRLLQSVIVNNSVELFTYTHVREDALLLFGFSTEEELSVFELLLGVSGIGPKTALTVLNNPVERITQAIASADVSFFTSVPRLGTKNAQKIIIELKSKLDMAQEQAVLSGTGEDASIVEALAGFGFSKKEALAALKKLPAETLAMEEKVKGALKLLGKKT